MGYWRAAVWGVVVALVVLILGVVGTVFVAPGMRPPTEVPGDRLMVVVAGRGGPDGSQVAQLIGVLDLSGRSLTLDLVDPLMKVTVPGTAYDRLRDAYPFGGGEGVSKAWGAAEGVAPIPVVWVSQDAFVRAVDGLGGIVVDIPFEAGVFDGHRLMEFEPGERRLGGAEVVALLESAEHRQGAGEQMRVRSAVTKGLAFALAERPPRDVDVSSSLGQSDLLSLSAKLTSRRGSVVVR